LAQIQKSLEIYKQDQEKQLYPANDSFLQTKNSCWSSGSNCTGNVYMRNIPVDPNSKLIPIPYVYKHSSDQVSYLLCACLENTADQSPACSANGALNCPACSDGKCYMLTEP